MNKFSGRYEVLAEAALNRFQQGGFLIGDHVKIKKGALNNEYIKGMSEQYKQRIKDFMDSDVNLRICAVKTTYPDTSFSVVGSPDNPTGAFLDVVQEISPANWVNPTTIPMDVVEYIDNDFYEEVPDSLKRMSPDPTEFDKDGNAKGDMGADDYMRMSKDLNLATKNTKLANANKWDDNKPGGGNTKGVTKPKKLNDSVRVSDEKMLSEAYSNILNESGTVEGAKPVVGTPTKATPESISKRLGIDVTTADPTALEAAIKRVYPNATPEQIQGVIPRIQAVVKPAGTPAAATTVAPITPTEVTMAPTDATATTEAPSTPTETTVAPTTPTETTWSPEEQEAFANEPGIDEPGGYTDRQGYQEHDPQTAQGVMKQQERRPDDQRFAALMDLRRQQMDNDQYNTQRRLDQQDNDRYNRRNDRDAGYNAYAQSQWQQPQQMQPYQQGPQSYPQQSENPNDQNYVDPMRSSPRTQSQTWSGGSQNFGGQLGNILQNTGLNTAEGAGNGLANSIGGAVGNIVGAAGQGLGDRVYRSTSGNRGNNSRYNSGSGQRSRYQSVGGQPRNR